ncbi:MAG: sigma-70 family RNA polymerase sigma factor [Clostridiales bacterium]|nr:sigma-70 family RNA polymerase sigma factor [Clostridiales bacterium]
MGVTQMEEREALKRLRRGEETTLAWFIQRYTGYVSTIIANIGGASMPRADLEEATSDVFYILWVNAKQVAPDKVKAYLGGVARNKAREYARKQSIGLPLEEDVLQITVDGPERQVETKELAICLRRAISSMQHPEQEIFLRHYYYYQPVAVIAEELGLNLSTVKTKLCRGRKKLKEQLTKGGYTVEDTNF